MGGGGAGGGGKGGGGDGGGGVGGGGEGGGGEGGGGRGGGISFGAGGGTPLRRGGGAGIFGGGGAGGEARGRRLRTASASSVVGSSAGSAASASFVVGSSAAPAVFREPDCEMEVASVGPVTSASPAALACCNARSDPPGCGTASHAAARRASMSSKRRAVLPNKAGTRLRGGSRGTPGSWQRRQRMSKAEHVVGVAVLPNKAGTVVNYCMPRFEGIAAGRTRQRQRSAAQRCTLQTHHCAAIKPRRWALERLAAAAALVFCAAPPERTG